MNLMNAMLSLLDIFRLEKGRKIAQEPTQVTVPLLQRLTLPTMAGELFEVDKVQFVADVINENIAQKRLPKRISKRVVHKISRYYSLKNLKGYGLFLAVPETNLLVIKSVWA